jgi:hypothetical protein
VSCCCCGGGGGGGGTLHDTAVAAVIVTAVLFAQAAQALPAASPDCVASTSCWYVWQVALTPFVCGLLG